MIEILGCAKNTALWHNGRNYCTLWRIRGWIWGGWGVNVCINISCTITSVRRVTTWTSAVGVSLIHQSVTQSKHAQSTIISCTRIDAPKDLYILFIAHTAEYWDHTSVASWKYCSSVNIFLCSVLPDYFVSVVSPNGFLVALNAYWARAGVSSARELCNGLTSNLHKNILYETTK